MPDKRPEKIPKTRDGKSDQTQADSENEHYGPGTERIVSRDNKEGGEKLPIGFTPTVDETARDIKILNTIAAIEKQQLESIFYPYRPHRLHLSTRFGLLFTTTR